MEPITEREVYNFALFKVTVKLSGATDTCYVIARHTEDAVREVRQAYTDFNVLYLEAIERLSGEIYVSDEAKEALKEAFDS
jgi:hypothetical protein